jgi:hypothetical protein
VVEAFDAMLAGEQLSEVGIAGTEIVDPEVEMDTASPFPSTPSPLATTIGVVVAPGARVN